MGRNGREAHVDRLYRRRLPDRFGRGRRLQLVTLACAGVCLVLSVAVPAAEGLISPQYQAKMTDTGLEIGAIQPATDPSGGNAANVAAWADPQQRGSQLGNNVVGWYRTQNARYQLRQTSSQRMGVWQDPMSPAFSAQNRASKGDQIARWIAVTDAQDPGTKVISSAGRPTGQVGDARILLRLGLALGLAYLVFLVAWFWTTRHGTHGAARVVRF